LPNRAEKSENSGYDGTARREGQGERCIRLLAPLESPGIIAAIVDGTEPANLTVTGLAKALPRSWAPQTGLRHTSNFEKAFVSRVMRRLPILIFRFCRSAKLVETCLGSGLPSTRCLTAPMHSAGL